MSKKILISLIIILFTVIAFNNNVFANTSFEALKTETQELLNEQLQNNIDSISNYYESLMQIKEKLNESILEKTENTEELQKLKYQISMKIIQVDESIKINYVEDETIKYTGYIPTMLGVNIPSSARNVEILSYKGTRISGKIAFDGAGKYTDLKSTSCLFCQQHGGSLTSVSKSQANVDDGEDGTLYVTGKDGRVVFRQEVFTDYVGQRIGRYVEEVSGYEKTPVLYNDKFGQLTLSDYYANPEEDAGAYELDNYHSTRSIANFQASAREFKEAESYIVSHAEDNTGDYPSYVQQAYWLYQEGSGGQTGGLGEGGVLPNASGYPEDADGAGTTIEETAKQLAQEGLKFEEERLTPLGSGAQNKSNMNEATVVYNLDENCWYAGPFKLSYERKILKIANGATSKIAEIQSGILANKVPGIVEYRGINSIKFYDEAGKELKGVEFIITNKGGREEGDEGYKFPYPNEEFYIKIPYAGNETAKEFEKMEVELFDMYSEGKGYDLEGTYEKLGWTGRKYPVLCTERARCSVHPNQYAGHTIRREVDYHYSWCPIDCNITHYEEYDCVGVPWCYTHHGRADVSHVKTWEHYMVANDETRGPYDAQKELCVEEAKIGILFTPTTITIDKDLTINMGGTVFEDEHTGKETDQNGIKDSNEKGIKGVKVTITPITEEGEKRETYTDENGKWYMEDVKVGKYDVEFEYDGQTYKATKYLASGDLKNINDSKAQEKESERQEFNNKFYEITETLNGADELTTGTAIGTDGTKNTLNYETNNRVSEIITREADTNRALDLYKMRARTSSTDLYYPIEDLFSIDNENEKVLGKNYIALYPYLENINLGLIQRAKADLSLSTDVYQAHIRIKEVFQDFTYNARNIDGFEGWVNKIENETYENYINKADYDWNWDSSLSEIYPNADSAELQVIVDYKVIIRNQSEKASTRITELVNHYNDELVYNQTTLTGDVASWIVLDNTEGESETEIVRREVKWNATSKYGKNETYSEHNTMYTTDIADIELAPGQTLELHIMYNVKRDSKIIMDEDDQGKTNVVEINAYQTYADNKVEGRIDTDSNPGNATPIDYTQYEDDTDKAPYFRLIFDREKSNIIEGNIWEDLRTETLENNKVIGDGIRQENEPTVGGVLVELVEVYKNEDTDVEIERVVDQTVSSYNADGAISNGGYRFKDISQGTYRVRFIYGTESQLTQDLKYNGQDYQATIVNGEIIQNSVQAQVMFLVDTSGSMYSLIGNAKAAASNLASQLIEDIGGVEMGVSYTATGAGITCQPTEDYEAVRRAINQISVGLGGNRK